MPGLQPIHLILILIIALVIFGPSRLPELGRSLGQSINEFKNATRDMTDPVKQAAEGTRDSRPAPAAETAARPEAGDNHREQAAEVVEK